MKAVLLTSSILIALIAALRPLLRGRVDPRVQYALWLAVVLRLLIPVNFAASAYSALSLLDRAEEQTHLAQNIAQLPLPIRSYQSAHDQALREFEARGEAVTHVPPAEIVNNRTQELMRGPTLSELFEQYARPVWLGGTAATALWFLLVNLRLRRKLRWALPVEADCPLPVYVTPELPSPCLCGAVRPAVYVTPAALESPDRLRHVLAHELTHCRHKDHWWALVRCLCLCAYWFNPLVWWAAALSRQDCELACDEGAIRRLGEGERLPYGRTLVDMIAAGRTPLLQTATTMTGGKRRVRERIKLIAHRPKTVVAVAAAAALIVICAVGCTFTGAAKETPAQNLSAGTLRERLGNIPEDLRPEVVNHADLFNDTSVLASYWWDVPVIDWENESMPWLLTVYQWDQARVDAEGYFVANDTGVSEIFARDGKWYYSIVRPMNTRFELADTESYIAAYQAIREYAEKTVLNTEGVEPFTPEQTTNLQSADILQARLTELPEEWDDVVVEQLDMVEDGSVLLALRYWLDVSEEERAVGAGRIADVYLWSRPQFQRAYFGGSENRAGLTSFAKTGDGFYFVIGQPTSAAFPRDSGPERYLELFDAVPEFIRETLLSTEGVVPFSPEEIAGPLRTVRAVMDEIAYAPGTSFVLSHPNATTTSPYPYIYNVDTPPDDVRGISLREYFYGFAWEELTQEQAAALMEQEGDGVSLLVGPSGADSSACITVYKDSPLTAVRTVDNEMKWYRTQCLSSDGSYVSDYFFYDYLRWWYDEVEIKALRAPAGFIPDRGQSREDIARAWAEGYEGALTKVSPGNPCACTYMSILDLEADLPHGLDGEDLEDFARAHGFSAEDFGKTWFSLSYSTMFVPVDDRAFWAGNTRPCEEPGAPEGALSYSRVGFMQLTNEGWTCIGVGTGW